MKKIIVIALAFSVFLASCSENGRKVEADNAKKVEVVKEATSAEFKTVKEGSHLEWRASHLGGIEPRFGKVSLKSADISAKEGKLATAKIEIDLATLTVENFKEDTASMAKLKGHLKSADFFNIEKFPTATFEVTKVEEAKGDFNAKVTGNLAIQDSVKSITFNANIAVSDTEFSIKSEDFSVNRKDWGLNYHTEGTEGVPANYLIADQLGFTIDVTVTK